MPPDINQFISATIRTPAFVHVDVRAVLSSSTVLHIPIDACGDYFSTSRMCSASGTSGLYLRVWGWVGRCAGGGLVRVVRLSFSAPAGPGKEPAASKPPRKLVELILFLSRLIAKQGPYAIHCAMTVPFTLCLFSCFIRASGINSHLTGTRAVSIFCLSSRGL
jgi:hypothetical protein